MVQKKRNNRPLYIGLATAVVAGLIFFILQLTHTTHFFQSPSGAQKQQEANYNNQRKEASADNSGNPSSTDDKGNPVGSNGTYVPPNDSSSITVTPSQQGNQVVISTKLSGYSDGSCALSITNSDTGKSYSQNVDVIYAPDFSTCAGFNVPLSELGTGNWSISLLVTSGGVKINKSVGFVVK